jgi:hypothetical protein
MNVQHHLFGYDKEGHTLRVELPIGRDQLDAVRCLIEPREDDPDILDPYPLDANQVEKVSEAIGRNLDASTFDWFIQAFAEQPSALPA